MIGSFIDDLADVPGLNDFNHSGTAAAKPAKQRETFPCESCGGTGRYRGVRLHQPATECFACKGKGYFFTSRKDRMAKRAAGAARKQAKVATAQAAFIEQHPGLIERLRKEAEWNSFAGEMLQKFNQWQSLTDRQIAACAAMFAKIDAKRAEKQAAKSASTGEVNIAAIEAMFSKARDSGLNKLAFRAGGLTISPAKESSRNAGALYVKRGDTYMGKILGGKFLPVSSATPDVLETIRTIAANPPEAAREYGRKTGICCCCGRELTDPESMAAGIGPVCATKWGL